MKGFLKKLAILAVIVLAFNLISKNYKDKKAESVAAENTISYSSYRELNDYAKKNANDFIEILKNHNIEYSAIPTGMLVANKNNFYEKYTNKYIYETTYRMIPHYNRDICYEYLNVSYQFPSDEKINEELISVFVDAVNTLTEEEISLEELKNEISKDDFKSYNPNNNKNISIQKEAFNDKINFSYRRELNGNMQGHYAVENEMIVGPKVNKYDTVQEYLDSIEVLKEDFENKYGKRFNCFSYEISNGTILGVKGVDKQFSEKLSIIVDEDILNDTEDAELNTIISIIEEFCGSEIIDKDLIIDSIKSININTEYYQDIIPEYTFCVGEDINIFLQNYRDYGDYFVKIDIDIPVIAEGIAYVDLY